MESERVEASDRTITQIQPAIVGRTGTRWLAIFADRHGSGAYEELIGLLERPCVTFAQIAKRFGVTRERVRQWHLALMPGAPRGHDRQQLCGAYHQKRRLLAEPLFRSFYQHARPHVGAGRITLIKSNDGYRTRAVRIDQRTVAIREAGRSAMAKTASGVRTYSLPRYQARPTSSTIGSPRTTTCSCRRASCRPPPRRSSIGPGRGIRYSRTRSTPCASSPAGRPPDTKRRGERTRSAASPTDRAPSLLQRLVRCVGHQAA